MRKHKTLKATKSNSYSDTQKYDKNKVIGSPLEFNV